MQAYIRVGVTRLDKYKPSAKGSNQGQKKLIQCPENVICGRLNFGAGRDSKDKNPGMS